MLARVQSYVLQGIDAAHCEIECDIDIAGIAKEVVVGLPDAAVKESLERVRAAVGNTGYRFPQGRLVVNLAPADVRKEGPVYDLPIAVGMLIADGTIVPSLGRGAEARVSPRGNGLPDPAANKSVRAASAFDHRGYLFAGELSLDGRLRPIRGALAMAALARQRGLIGVVVPAENAQEAAVVEGIDVIGAASLPEVVGILNGTLEAEPHPPVDVASLIAGSDAEVDFAEVRGQEAVKRAIVVAASGSHNLLQNGPSGGSGYVVKVPEVDCPTLLMSANFRGACVW